MDKRIAFFILFTFSLIVSASAQRTLKYAIDSDNNLILSSSSVPLAFYTERDLEDQKLSAVNIPSSIEGRKVVGIGKKVFYGDSTLTQVYIPASIEYIGDDAFSDCRNLKKITVASDNPRYKVEGNFLIDKTSNKLVSVFRVGEEVVIPEGITEIPENFFSFANQLKKVVLPDSLIRIGDKAFYKQYNLCSINFPKNLQYIGDNAFEECQKLAVEVDLPESLLYLGKEAFKNSKITAVSLPSNFESLADGLFCGCNNLTTVKLPSNLKIVGNETFSPPP